MWELGPALLPRLSEGEPVALVTVTGVPRSAPRPVGSSMALLRDGSLVGSLSSGCVDGDAALLASEVLTTGRAVTTALGLSDDDARAAGLACGGSVDVVVHRVDPRDPATRPALAALTGTGPGSARVGVVLAGPRTGELLDETRLPRGAVSTGVVEGGSDGHPVLVLVRPPRQRLVLVGAGEHAVALCALAAAAGVDVVVCDVWDRLVTAQRFPAASRLAVGTPEELLPALLGGWAGTAAVCVLSHDDRVDVPALEAALRLGAAFVGAMGSRASRAHRAAQLAARGVGAADVARVRMPLGLDLGADDPTGTALAVLAEVVAARHGGSGLPLRDLSGPVHRRSAASRSPDSTQRPGRETPRGGDPWTSTPSPASAEPAPGPTWRSPRAKCSSPVAPG